MKITSFCSVVVLLFALVVAEDVIKYAGTTEGAPTWAVPSVDDSGVCTQSTTAAPYVVLNTTWTSGGVREVIAMAENDFKPYITVYVYNTTFNPTTPCSGVLVLISSGGVPPVDDWRYFEPNTLYFFVISASAGSSVAGRLAVNIFPGIYGATNASSPGWPAIRSTADGSCSTVGDPGTIEGLYSTYTWTQATTGRFDITLLFDNASFPTESSWGTTYLALFSGSFSNPSAVSDPCNVAATGATFLNASSAYGLSDVLYYVSLTAGSAYSIIFSGSGIDKFGYYSIQVEPTLVRFPVISQQRYFTQPERVEIPPPPTLPTCGASSDTQAAWDAVVFTAEQRVYIIDQGVVPDDAFDSFDSYSFMYAGLNAGNETDTSVPTTCPLLAPLIFMGDTGDVTPMVAFTAIGTTYTVVVSTYSGGDLSGEGYNYAYILYAFTGLPIGTLPASTTGAPTGGGQSSTGGQATGGGSTTKSATTGGLTSGMVSSTSRNSTTSTGGARTLTTTSAAQTNSVALVVLLAMLIVAML